MDYVIQQCFPKAAIFTDKGEMQIFFKHKGEILDKNSKHRSDFYAKLCKAKGENKLRSFDSLSADEFYDLRISMSMLNCELFNLFGISKHGLSKASTKYQIYCDMRQILAEMNFGIREIDVDKFVKQLTV